MMKLYTAGIVILFFAGSSFCQTNTDTIKNEKAKKLESGMNPTTNNLPLQLLNPFQKKVLGETLLPLNLHIYSQVFANDYKPGTSYSSEDLTSGLSAEELYAFNNNKTRLQKVLTDFYGEDLVNIAKFLESLGLTKEQIVALAAMLKFIFAPGMLAAPN
jgi:hypothetical protein